MGKFIVKRLLFMIPVIIAVTLAIFILSFLAAGDAARILAEKKYEHPSVTQIEEVRHEQGLDRPILIQYADWLNHVLHGDFGNSYSTGKPAIDELCRCFPQTAKLALTALVLLIIIGIPLGILSAVMENTAVDHVIQGFAFFSVSMPSFWLGLMLLFFFGVKLRVISVIGGSAAGIPIFAAFALDIGNFGLLIRLVRVNVIHVMKQDYIRASRAKGLSTGKVIMKHAVKNSIIPVMTRMVGMIISLFCGSAVIESIFSINGIGKLALESVVTKDSPVLQCFIFFLSVGVVVINLVVDILYSAIDRRIRLV